MAGGARAKAEAVSYPLICRACRQSVPNLTIRNFLRHARACPGHPRSSIAFDAKRTWMAGTQASGSDAVLRTAMPGHDDVEAYREIISSCDYCNRLNLIRPC